jgi:membrane protein
MSRFYRPYNKHFGKGTIPDSTNKSEQNPLPEENPVARKIRLYLESKTFKGLHGHSLYDVGRYFLRSLFMENLSVRASSLSFNFFLALFPALIFLLTLIAYLPFDGLKTQLMEQLSMILPERSYKEIADTISEILNKQNSSLLSFGFIFTIYFASNAFHLLISSFNKRLVASTLIKQNWFIIRGKAVFLTVLQTVLIIIFLSLVTWAYQIEHYMEVHNWPLVAVYNFFVELLKYILMMGLFLLAISSLYYFAPSKTDKWKFFTIGSFLASALSIIATFGFTIYVNNFDSYNKIYGSIGAILALMVLIYINVLLVIIGFELNTSIDKAEIRLANRNKL